MFNFEIPKIIPKSLVTLRFLKVSLHELKGICKCFQIRYWPNFYVDPTYSNTCFFKVGKWQVLLQGTVDLNSYKGCIQRAYFLDGLKLHVYLCHCFEQTSCHKVCIQIASFFHAYMSIEITVLRKLFSHSLHILCNEMS